MTPLEPQFIEVYTKLYYEGGGLLDRLLICHGDPNQVEDDDDMRRKIEELEDYRISDLRWVQVRNITLVWHYFATR